MEMMIAITLQC